MVTATERRRIAKRQQITAAAHKLFLSQGYAATSMDVITAEAGVSKQTLYAYFPTKIELLAHTVYSGMSKLMVAPTDPGEINSIEQLREWLIDFSERLVTNLMQPQTAALLRLVLGEAFHVPELRRTFREALPGQALGTVRRVLTIASERGLLKIGDFDLASRMFIGPLFTFIVLDGFLSVDPIERPPRRTLEHLTDVYLSVQERP